ncbi:MAG: type II secretion system protein GspN [Desulfobacterales bacterium]
MQIFRAKIFWVFYIICAVVFFFYILFPSDTVKEYLADQIRQAQPDFTVEIGRLKPGFPLDLKLYDVCVYHLGQTLAEMENLKISPNILSLFLSTTHLSFRGSGYGGTFNGQVDISKNSANKEMTINTDLAGIQVEQVKALSAITTHQISGDLEGTLTFNTKAPHQGLSGDLILSDGQIKFSPPLLNQNTLSFNTIETEVMFNNRSLTINRCQIEGNQLDAYISGSIKVSGRSTRKILDLSGTVKPHAALLARLGKNIPQLLADSNSEKQGFAFKITGTMNAPEYSFN